MANVGQLFGTVRLKGGNKFQRDFRKTMDRVKKDVFNLRNALQGAVGAFVLKDLNNEANRATNAMLGLRSVANFKGIKGAPEAIKELEAVEKGMIDSSDAAATMQNLLLRFGSLETATQVFDRLSQAAAFNRAQHLNLGEAVRTASEGLKNENSILVDNAGVTKNVSVMWKEYAKQIGKGVMSLTQAEKAEAERLGILKETTPFIGNLAKLNETAAGSQAKFTAELTRTKVQFGLILQSFSPVLEKFSALLSFLNNSSQSMRNFIAAIVATIIQLRVLKGVVDLLELSMGKLPIFWVIAGITSLVTAFGFFESATDRAAKSLMKFREEAEKLEVGDLEKEELKLAESINKANQFMKERIEFFKSKGLTEKLAAKSARALADKMIRADKRITASTLAEAEARLKIVKDRQKDIARIADQGFNQRIGGLDKKALEVEKKALLDLMKSAEATEKKWSDHFKKMGNNTAAAQKVIDKKVGEILTAEKRFNSSSLADARKRLETIETRLRLVQNLNSNSKLSEADQIALKSATANIDAFIQNRIKAQEAIGLSSAHSLQQALSDAEKQIESDSNLNKAVRDAMLQRLEIKQSEADALVTIEEDRQQRMLELHEKAIAEQEEKRAAEEKQFQELIERQKAHAKKMADAQLQEQKAGNQRLATEAENNARNMADAVGSISAAFFEDAINNTRGMKNFWKSILLEIVTFIERELVMAKIHAIIKSVLSGGTSSLKDLPMLAIAAGLLQGAKAGIRAMATGGVLTKPEVVLAGEAGPEVIAPYDQFLAFANRLLAISAANTESGGERVFERIVEKDMQRNNMLLNEARLAKTDIVNNSETTKALTRETESVFNQTFRNEAAGQAFRNEAANRVFRNEFSSQSILNEVFSRAFNNVLTPSANQTPNLFPGINQQTLNLLTTSGSLLAAQQLRQPIEIPVAANLPETTPQGNNNLPQHRDGDINFNVNFSGPLHDRRMATKLADEVLKPAIADSKRRQRRIINEEVFK